VSFGDGALFVALLVGYTTFLIIQSRRQTKAMQDEYTESFGAEGAGWDSKLPAQIALIVVGLGLLVLGSNLLVDAAIVFARYLGISETVIGLTIVAAGTSLPEVAASVTAALRGQRDIAVGNVVGSNTFNILGALGVSALVAPVDLPCRLPCSFRHARHGRRGRRLPAHLPERQPDRSLGRRAVLRLLHRLHALPRAWPRRSTTHSATTPS
jgi:Ca2+/Na+ antiporter